MKINFGSIFRADTVGTISQYTVTVVVFLLPMYVFYRNCGSHLRRAASATTVEVATKELSMGVRYLEKTKRTNGFSHFLFKSSRDDVGEWYSKLRNAQIELEHIEKGGSVLERESILRQVRKLILADEALLTPSHIYLFPYQRIVYGSLLGISLAPIMILAGWIFVVHIKELLPRPASKPWKPRDRRTWSGFKKRRWYEKI